jgi:hypothetical protein
VVKVDKKKKCCGNCGHKAHKSPLRKKVVGGDSTPIEIEICSTKSKNV